MISVNSLGVEFSARPLFKDVSFVINKTDKMALVGKNGAGKSTLLKILAGQQEPTTGNVNHPVDITIGYLPQQMQVADETTLIDETRKAFSEAITRNSKLEEITHQLETRTDYDTPEYQALFEQMQYLQERIEMEGNGNMEAEAEKTLLGLGFRREDFQRPTAEFSGGWRMRIELAKLLLKNCDLLLLDEPTNHLDIESIQWLENFLSEKAKAVLLVSHDRAFLDNVTTRTIEINCGKIYDYKVKYSEFVELRKERVDQQMRAWENQQKLISDTKAFIERFRYKPTKAVQVQSRIKMLEKMEPIEVDEVDNSRLRLKFPPAERSGDYPLILNDVGKAYGDHQVFDHAEFTIKRGEKVAFVGRNGEGKSTLVKCIMGDIPYTGTIKIGHNVKIGYFAQNQAQLLDETLSVFDTIDRVATGDIRLKIRDLLGAFLFGGEDIDKKVKVLSGGERTRLAMIKLLLEPVNLLILDEPTNHLDMRTKDVLKEAIRDFTGTVIAVSHDREFLDGLVEKVYEFHDGRVTENIGGIYDFLQKKRIKDLKEIEHKKTSGNLTKPSVATGAHPAEEVEKKENSNKLSYIEQKERDKIIKKARKRVEKAELEVERCEGVISELEQRLSEGEATNEVLESYDTAKRELEEAMSEWEDSQEALDNLM